LRKWPLSRPETICLRHPFPLRRGAGERLAAVPAVARRNIEIAFSILDGKIDVPCFGFEKHGDTRASHAKNVPAYFTPLLECTAVRDAPMAAHELIGLH
jgi:hypothetical protein